MAWQTSNRRNELPPNWQTIRQQVLQRERHQCQWITPHTGQRCTETTRIEIHHAQGRDNHHPNALIALCKFHHDRITTREAMQARAHKQAQQAKNKQRAHPGYKHA